MYKLVFAAVVQALAFYSVTVSASGSGSVAKVPEPGQSFQSCVAQFPPALQGEDLTLVTGNTRWYVKYTDETYFKRVTPIFLSGKEDHPLRESAPYFESACLTDVNEPFIPGVPVPEKLTSGSISVTLPLLTTLDSTGVITSVYHFPNTQTPALTIAVKPAFTDRRTYVLCITCLDDGHRGFEVFTTQPELDSQSINRIHNYLIAAGFGLGEVTTYDASKCSNVP